jgi:hypothetical protein
MRLAIAIGLTALVSSFLDPELGFDLLSLGTFLGFVIALFVILFSFEVPALLEHRRVTGELGRLRVLRGRWCWPQCSCSSPDRHPPAGYLWGVVMGVVFCGPIQPPTGSEQAAGALDAHRRSWHGTAGGRAWPRRHRCWSSPMSPRRRGAILGGLEAWRLASCRSASCRCCRLRWSRPIWASSSAHRPAFFHILIGPTRYLADLSFGAWMAALGVFLAFGVITVLLGLVPPVRRGRREG